MSQQVNLKNVQQKLFEKLGPSGWGTKLQLFVKGEEFYSILNDLVKEKQAGNRFTPGLKHLFTAFEKCPYEKTKIVILGQDPYPKPGVADGMAFSCGITGKPEASLRQIHKAIKKETNSDYQGQADLSYLANQGVLLLNTSLTTRLGEPGSHQDLWKPFMRRIIESLANDDQKRIYVFLGSKAKYWAQFIPNTNFKFFASHPASAAYANTQWDAGDLFTGVNKIAKEQFNLEIKW